MVALFLLHRKSFKENKKEEKRNTCLFFFYGNGSDHDKLQRNEKEKL
jgi:hypothetical protein